MIRSPENLLSDFVCSNLSKRCTFKGKMAHKRRRSNSIPNAKVKDVDIFH